MPLLLLGSIITICRHFGHYDYNDCTARQCWLIRQILVYCSIITPTFISLRKHLVIGQLNEYRFLLCFSLVNQRHTSGITVYNRTVTKSKTVCEPCIVINLFYPYRMRFGWLVGCFGLKGPLRQYFSLYRAVSQREGEGKRNDRREEKMSKQPHPHLPQAQKALALLFPN